MRFAFDLFDHLFDTFDLRLKNKYQSIGFAMPRKLTESTRSAIVQKWLEGPSRNKISAQCSVSQATVSGIVDDWKKSVGVSLAEQYRDLALTLERNGISVVQCAQDFRIFKLMSNLSF